MQWHTIKPVLWGAVGGAFVWWILLSAWLGWMTPGYAAKQAEAQSEAAVLEVLTPICLAQFQQDDTRVSKLTALKQVNSWMRSSFVAEHGWATMPGASKARDDVAGKCAGQILAANPS